MHHALAVPGEAVLDLDPHDAVGAEAIGAAMDHIDAKAKKTIKRLLE